MPYLSDSEIVNFITDYIKKKTYNYAIMLNGEWGSGKTYFVKEKLIKAINLLKNCDVISVNQESESSNTNNLKSIYITLYGINTVDEIASRMLFTLLEIEGKTVTEKAKPLLPILELGVKFFTDKFVSSSLMNDTSSLVLSTFSHKNNYVFIFDDLERCKIPVESILGFINGFVEQNNQKAIIIANETEITQNKIQLNQELKYLLACSGEKIKFSKNEKLQTNNGGIDLADLNNRVEYIFGEDSHYKQIKEKLIGATITYHPDLTDTITSIIHQFIENNIEKQFNDLYSSYIDNIIEVMNNRNHTNLRTLQYSLLFFMRVSTLLSGRSLEKKTESILCKDIFFAILKQAIAFKQGNPRIVWESESVEFKYLSFDENRFNIPAYFNAFRFIDDYLYDSSFEHEKIENVLDNYSNKIKQNTGKDPIGKLKDYWRMEDKEVILELKNLKDWFLSSKYETQDYKFILSLLYKIKELGFNVYENEFFTRMLENIQQGAQLFDNYEEIQISKSNTYYSEYLKSAKLLDDYSLKSKKTRALSELRNIFDKEDWPTQFKDNYHENRDFYLRVGMFSSVSLIDCEKALNNASTEKFSDFRRIFISIYGNRNTMELLEKDSPAIQKLKKYLESAKYDQKTKEYNRKYFIDQINDVLAWKEKGHVK